MLPGRALLSLPADDDIHNTNNIKVIQFDISWNYEYRNCFEKQY